MKDYFLQYTTETGSAMAGYSLEDMIRNVNCLQPGEGATLSEQGWGSSIGCSHRLARMPVASAAAGRAGLVGSWHYKTVRAPREVNMSCLAARNKGMTAAAGSYNSTRCSQADAWLL